MKKSFKQFLARVDSLESWLLQTKFAGFPVYGWIMAVTVLIGLIAYRVFFITPAL